MNITVTKLIILKQHTRMRALASITLNDAIAIHDIKIIEKASEKKYIVVLPSYLDSKNKYRNIVHPITQELRQDLNEKVLAAFFIEKNKHQEGE